ncbi:2-Methylcitrate dehydratase AcnD [Candidatus Rhodobacter oscarellae]|uniref:2-Methylcitrate dehydratase AcnD n=1 Tax=Candidatus Rhodobacter oscarellae TaxID=1675527 RepID=A0A0J9E6P4_9RHOB|nr:aconitase X [Candidatus Rhodobacter lobularis]KMW58331.1 2-Methylcitrate dehydratase AcnD [Candidatus Rhodobacter lobularis]
MDRRSALLIVPADVKAQIVRCDEGLSFWGGVDPSSGTVIDAHHHLHGQSLAGRIVMMPTSRGSCSGSGVLLQLALNGMAPAALVFRDDEEVLTLGALIAGAMFDRTVGIVRLGARDYDALSAQNEAHLQGARLVAGEIAIDLHRITQDDLALSDTDRAMLNGGHGEPAALAMQVISAMAAAQGAKELIDVTRGHIDGCIYAHEANLIFAETMAEMGAQVAIPTTINAISVDREDWEQHDLPPNFGRAASRLADAYVRMGARSTFTCAPYLSGDAPRLGEEIGWSESNAVIFANSVLGARTAKHPDYLDLFIALTGRAARTGVYLAENRRPQMRIDVELPDGHDDAVWPLIGWIAGGLAPDCVPLLTGLEAALPSRDDLRALCAAFGTTSAAPLLHVAGVTPEAGLPLAENAARATVTRADLVAAWRELNAGPEAVDLIALGSPHFSLEETRAVASLMAGKQKHPDVEVIITLGREIFVSAEAEGLIAQLRGAGVQFYRDLCWCSIVEPIFPTSTRTVMTNSGKYAHYAPGLSGRAVRFGGLSDCVAAAQTACAPASLPGWLTG